MNNLLFIYFFSLSQNPSIAWISIFVSYVLIYVFILFAIFYPIIKKSDYIYGILSLITGGVAYIFSYIIKNIFIIPRPFIINNIVPLVVESGYSFPSSHVTVIAALTIITWKYNQKLGIVFALFTILTVFSRMIIGVHYPVDVIAGIVFGAVIGFFILWFYNKTKEFAFLRKKL